MITRATPGRSIVSDILPKKNNLELLTIASIPDCGPAASVSLSQGPVHRACHGKVAVNKVIDFPRQVGGQYDCVAAGAVILAQIRATRLPTHDNLNQAASQVPGPIVSSHVFLLLLS